MKNFDDYKDEILNKCNKYKIWSIKKSRSSEYEKLLKAEDEYSLKRVLYSNWDWVNKNTDIELDGVFIFEKEFTGVINLSRCSIKNITLPEIVHGCIYLTGCNLVGIVLPKIVRGTINVAKCNLQGVKLPEEVEWIDLRGCNFAGAVLPQKITEGVDLNDVDIIGCNLNKVVLPENIKITHGLEDFDLTKKIDE